MGPVVQAQTVVAGRLEGSPEVTTLESTRVFAWQWAVGDLVYRDRRVGVGGERATSIRCSLVGHEGVAELAVCQGRRRTLL